MLLLTGVVLLILFFVYLSQNENERRIQNDNKKKEKLFIFIATFVMIMYAGLRKEYNDTSAYMLMFIKTKGNWSAISQIDWNIGHYPGFDLSLIILKMIGVTPQMFIFIFSALTIGIMMWFIYKYSDKPLMPVFIFITFGIYTFVFAAIKQCFAVALCLVAIDAFLRKKYFRFIIFVLVAALFHPYSILYLVVPFLRFTPWTKKTMFMLIGFITVGFSLQYLFGTITEIATDLGGEYSAESFKGDGINAFRVLVAWIPVLLSFFVRGKLIQNNDTTYNLFINLAFVNAGLMFVGLFGNANYFARFANYFAIFQALAIPYIIAQYDETDAKSIKVFATVGYSLFFVYANLINEKFDTLYKAGNVLDLFR